MQDKPDIEALLGAISAMLKDEVVPALTGHLALQVRIAANCLNIIRREVVHAEADGRAEHARLTDLLGEEADLLTLNKALCTRIGSGELGIGDAALMEHLWATTLAKVRIDQPNYPTYRRLHTQSR
jgi:hypothetical protein